MTETLTVELGDRSYPIVIGDKLLGGSFDLSAYVAGSDCLVVSDENVGPLYVDALKASLPGADVNVSLPPAGEAHKTLATVQMIIDELVACKANRDTTVIALGGGVVGDIAGFVASCYMRGVRFIQVPTTLLAQVDSSVGGKTGVNHPGGKNLVGAFYQPGIVLIDTDTLQTLPDRELRAGLAEVIKYGAIADLEFFGWLENNIDALLAKHPDALAVAIHRSCELKAEVVAEDEREAGRRAILNFGHTFGHAIENSVGYGEWLHGEAVAAGMVMAARLSDIPADEQMRLKSLIERAGLPAVPPAIGAGRMLEAMGLDKKAVGRKLRFVILDKLGAAHLTGDYDEDLLQQTLATANG